MKNKYALYASIVSLCTFGMGLIIMPNVLAAESHREEQHDESHSGEEHHDEEVVRLSDAELKEFNIILATARRGSMDKRIELPGEIALNADRMAHVVPRVEGIVRKVLVTVGDKVKKGDLIAVLDSGELAIAKAAYLAAIEREKLALANYQREKHLWEKKVTSHKEYLDVQQKLAEIKIERRSAEQQLHALGISNEVLEKLPKDAESSFTRFEIRAPQDGTIIEKHITFGENVNSDADIFTVADLSSVWVELNVYQKDLISIRKGQKTKIIVGHGIPSAQGIISWVSPRLNEATRTAKARLILDNKNGDLRPGLFVNGKVTVASFAAKIIVAKRALQTFEGKTVLFVRTEEGFEPSAVKIGKKNADYVEILSGLNSGQIYVDKGAFTLKAQLLKGAFGDGHNH